MKIDITMKIRWIRKANGISITKIADITGLSTKYISLVERSLKMPRLDDLIKISLALNENINNLYEYKVIE